MNWMGHVILKRFFSVSGTQPDISSVIIQSVDFFFKFQTNCIITYDILKRVFGTLKIFYYIIGANELIALKCN